MNREEYWQLLLDMLLNVGRQFDKNKLELSKNSIGPKEPELVLPFSLWSYDQSCQLLWRISCSEVNDLLFKSRIDNEYHMLRSGLKITIEELTESETLEKIQENIWSYEEIFPVEECEGVWFKNKKGWLYDNFEYVVEVLEATLSNNLFLNNEQALKVIELQKEYDCKVNAERQQTLNEIEEWKRKQLGK